MNLKTIPIVETYIGVVMEVDEKNWIIKFNVPGIYDENNKEFPRAFPIFNHVRQIFKGDEVLIIQPSAFQSDFFGYFPITINEEVGMLFYKNLVDIKKDGEILVKTDDIKCVAEENLFVENGQNNLVMNKEGKTDITSNIHVTGNLTVSTGKSGSFAVNNGSTILTFVEGILVGVS